MTLFATQYKNDSTAFHRSFAVTGCLALRTWSVEDWTPRKVLCERLNTEELGWVRERWRPSEWKWSQAVA